MVMEDIVWAEEWKSKEMIESKRKREKRKEKGRIRHTFDILEHDLDHSIAVRYIRPREMVSIRQRQQRLVDGAGVMLLFPPSRRQYFINHLRLECTSKQGGDVPVR